ncbi:hypothetical protein SARC_00492 [Sphaeroforma arctica JP610]|uniref:Right handed beta helix domain-containing protein n=1 Tax=Sphaeroforma arctica JP610 TaxID=667725 RepID=A0A0L0GEV7_9EUKA|nr:hypothetical protein SARC_00492 [Sphaeroforma arctica JP610]KNC87401.1 hypothetical protein SARC_00492 [Sphaeroforma arctica JP610]|eukprot:XP_014161303.1 hypothetical protein SARC_00492 [Sphaeroforma arctica JP610]
MFLVTTLVLAVAASLDGQPIDTPIGTARTTTLGNNCATCENGIWLQSGNTCYDNLALAIYSNFANEPLYISGTIEVENEIALLSSIKLVGSSCGASISKPKIVSRIDDDYDAIFVLSGQDGATYHFENIHFENGDDRSRLIRTAEVDEDQEETDDAGWSDMPAYNLALIDIVAEKFETKARGGSAVFMQVARSVLIDGSTFSQNNVADPGKELYGGGGAVWIHEVPKGNSVVVQNSIFTENTMEFEHGLGAAFYIAHIDGAASILNCVFRDNAAADGAAIHISRTDTSGSVIINSTFQNNRAASDWGARGSALRFKYIYGSVSIDGVYTDNETADGRSLIANNRVGSGASVRLAGTFINNDCRQGGAVWDSHMEFGGVMTISSGTSMVDNDSDVNPGTVIRLAGANEGDATTYKSADWVNSLTEDTMITL